jgi:hypothetical protein
VENNVNNIEQNFKKKIYVNNLINKKNIFILTCPMALHYYVEKVKNEHYQKIIVMVIEQMVNQMLN